MEERGGLGSGGRRSGSLIHLNCFLDKAASPPPFMDDSVDPCLARGRRVLIWTVGRRHCA
jgi:hypothetical protein